MRRFAAYVVAGLLTALSLTGCRDDRVRLAFRPVTGATYDYDTTVATTTRYDVPGQSMDDSTTPPVHFTSHLRVLDVAGPTARVEVVLSRPGTSDRTYVMRFDRAAQLTQVESVEGIPSDALGDLGLTEIFPPAAGAPPDRPLRPGDRWTIDDRVQINANDQPSRLQGEGQLTELGVVDGHRTATVKSSTTVPLRSVTTSADSTRTLDGVQVAELTVTYDLADGAVSHVVALTTAHYNVVISPPAGQAGDPLTGTLSVVVRSEISRR